MLELGSSIDRGDRPSVLFNRIEICQLGSLCIPEQVVRGVEHYIMQSAMIKSN